MLFSCKISNSVLSYLDRASIGREEIYSHTDQPVEFLRDPSYWLEADKMEDFLSLAESLIDSKEESVNFVEDLGHKSASLRSWGVLDGVLRMMQKPHDIFAQPDRFLSYFISPAPPIADIVREENEVRFVLPITSNEYPLVSQYLKSAIESLPSFVGKGMASVQWQGNSIRISWSSEASLFAEDNDPGHLMKPDFAQDLAYSLEQSQKDLENRNKELLLKNQELEKAKLELEQKQSLPSSEFEKELSSRLSLLQGDIHRLHDYMARAQQLITLLVGQGRQDRQVKEAMRRVDWQYVQKEYPKVAKDVIEALQDIRKKTKHSETQQKSSKELPLQQQLREESFH